MMKFDDEDCMTAEDFLLQNDDGTTKGVINNTTANVKATGFGEESEGTISKKQVNLNESPNPPAMLGRME